MPLTTSEIIENTALKHEHRIKLKYTFDDGSIVFIKCRGKDSKAAASLLLAKQSIVIENKTSADVESAIYLDSDAAKGEASQDNVYFGWMLQGYQQEDPYLAYKYMSKVTDKVLALGLTTSELAIKFESTIEEINKITARWQYLKTNKEAILAYETIRAGM